MTWVVTTLRGIRGTPGSVEEYLVCIRYDRYRTGDSNTHESSPDLDDAFKFSMLSAAEVAAVFVGGSVSTLNEERRKRRAAP